ncbi:MAG: hypothetical protein KDE33_13805 [Bacteroidetes bacterium]|nr:hypothetical protein [Bacteroidota bacterium]
MKTYYYLIISIVALWACAPNVEYQKTDNFTIDNNALKNGDKITLLYSSATPQNEEKLTYFIHLMAEKQETGDTVNILTVFNRGAGKGSSKNEFIFYTLNSDEGKAYFDKLKASYEIKKNIEDIDDIDRVTYDKRFDFLTKNNHPTIVGFIDKEE